MASENFARCLARILVYEGGNDDDPRDPGGRTSRGILQREYDRWLVATGRGSVIADHDVWKASDADIAIIYRTNYWDRMHCDELPSGVDITVFDSGVNSGVAQAAKWVQRATGIRVDGDFGPATLHALQNANDNDALVADILGRRLAMLQTLKTWRYYGKGWSARIANVLRIAQAWATGSVGPNPVDVSVDGGHRKARVEDVKQPIIPVSAAQIATGASAVGTGATAAAGQVQSVQSALPDRWQTIAVAVCAGLAITAAVAAFVAQQAQKRADAVKNADATAEVDAGADSDYAPVAVNDNPPPPEVKAA